MNEKEWMDKSSTSYSYSKNGLNLLTQKSTEEGLTVSYEYFKGTNLCTKTLTHDKGKIQKRIFREYDENGEIKTLVEDDGSSEDENNLDDVTYRRIKQVESVKTEGPSFGKPSMISEFYRDK